MFTDRKTFAKLLQDNESRVYWCSGAALDGVIAHEWRALEDGRLLLKETDMPHERLYWASVELMDGRG